MLFEAIMAAMHSDKLIDELLETIAAMRERVEALELIQRTLTSSLNESRRALATVGAQLTANRNALLALGVKPVS